MIRKTILVAAALAAAVLAVKKRQTSTRQEAGVWEPVDLKR